MMETIHSSETLVLARVIRRHTPEDGILHSHRLQTSNFKQIAVRLALKYDDGHNYAWLLQRDTQIYE
jgi:hypothetical protein